MPLKRIAVLVSGGGTNLQALLDASQQGHIDGRVVKVVSSREGAYALERARQAGIEAVCVPRKAYEKLADFEDKISEEVASCQPDLIVLAGYLSILPPALVSAYKNCIINVHPALIPAFCGRGFYGARVHAAVLEYGAKVSGATVHLVDEGTDTGPILLQQCVPVLWGDTPESLAARILPLEHALLCRAVAAFCNNQIRVNGRLANIETMEGTEK